MGVPGRWNSENASSGPRSGPWSPTARASSRAGFGRPPPRSRVVLALYESGHSLRKVISADPLRVQDNGVSLPNMVVSRDLRDFTTTLLMLDFSGQDPYPEDAPSFERLREGSN